MVVRKTRIAKLPAVAQIDGQVVSGAVSERARDRRVKAAQRSLWEGCEGVEDVSRLSCVTLKARTPVSSPIRGLMHGTFLAPGEVLCCWSWLYLGVSGNIALKH